MVGVQDRHINSPQNIMRVYSGDGAKQKDLDSIPSNILDLGFPAVLGCLLPDALNAMTIKPTAVIQHQLSLELFDCLAP